MSVLKIKDNEGKWVGVTAIQGEQGLPGVSPLINVNTNTSTTYKLRIVTEDKDFVTPNLKGSGGSGNGSAGGELGTIANYKDFEGKCIPAYKMDMPPLDCYEGGTTYVFDREVTMLVYDGAIDENGNTDIDKYVSYTGTEIHVPTQYTGKLTDYLIYNPVPKKDWDTWENPNLIKFMSAHDGRLFADLNNQENTWRDEAQRWAHFPNLKMITKHSTNNTTPFNQGDALILNKERWNPLTGKYEQDKGQYNVAVYRRQDFPFILDELPVIRKYDAELKEFTNPVTIEYSSEKGSTWDRTKQEYPAFRKGKDYTLENMGLDACDIDENGNPVKVDSNQRLMNLAEEEQEMLNKENVPGAGYNRAYDMVIAQQSHIESHLSEFGAKPVCAAMYVGLEPLKNYTIEATASDCAIILSNIVNRKHITKKKTLVYPVVEKTITVSKANAQQIGSAMNGIGGGAVTGGNRYSNGTVITYEMVDKTGDPEAEIEVPCALSMPEIYLKKGDSYTFQVEDEDEMYGIWICCWQEEDYQGIKIVEGIQPYSELMAERMASGATKFNIKTYWTPNSDWYVDTNQIMQEFNVKLCDNTTATDYCRLLNSDTIKHFDLDEFSMTNHEHTLSSIKDLADLKATIPKMILSTSTLADGVSELAENTFHFVYAE